MRGGKGEESKYLKKSLPVCASVSLSVHLSICLACSPPQMETLFFQKIPPQTSRSCSVDPDVEVKLCLRLGHLCAGVSGRSEAGNRCPPQQICTLLRSPWQPDGVRQSHISSSASLSSSPPAPLSLPSPAPPLPVYFRLSLSVSVPLFLPPVPPPPSVLQSILARRTGRWANKCVADASL